MSHRGADSKTRLERAVLTIGLVIAMCCASFVTLMAGFGILMSLHSSRKLVG